MGTTRFLFVQGFTGSVLINGNAPYTNEPARTEDPAFVMENAWDRDRYVVWSTGASPPSPVNFDVDLGSDALVTEFLILNRRTGTAGGLTQYKLQYRTAAQGYDGAAAFTDAHTAVDVSGGLRNSMAPAFSITGRYLRARFLSSGSFSVKIWGAANSIVDTGLIHAPGGTETLIWPSTDVMTPEGATHRFIHGSIRRRFALPFPVVDPTLWAKLRQAVLESRSFIYVTHTDEVYEVIVAPETAEALIIAPSVPATLRNITLYLEEQP